LQGGVVSVRGTPTRSVSVAQVASLVHDRARSNGDQPHPLEVAVEFTARAKYTFSNATHVATCEVDVHTGRVRLLRFVVSEDCGVMINPKVVEGQIAGGVVQGIGGVLFENFQYDADGNPLTTTYLDYLLPTAAEVPLIEYGHVVSRAADPGGFKGMGEGGAIGAPAAVINAVADALAPFGATITTQPLTPPFVLGLITDARLNDDRLNDARLTDDRRPVQI
jgi:aerobic carbon-monoxide dehydrogenase large subunit